MGLRDRVKEVYDTLTLSFPDYEPAFSEELEADELVAVIDDVEGEVYIEDWRHADITYGDFAPENAKRMVQELGRDFGKDITTTYRLADGDELQFWAQQEVELAAAEGSWCYDNLVDHTSEEQETAVVFGVKGVLETDPEQEDFMKYL